MKKIIIAFSVVFVSVFFMSCKKENDKPGSIDITGTWAFVSMDATTNSAVTAGTDKTVTTSSYTTENNTGTLTVDAATMSTSNLSYSVNTTAHASSYSNGTLLGTFDVPFDFAAPASSSTVSYRVISADSIYFDEGSIFMNGVTQETTPAGARLSMDGNTLYMTFSVHESTTQEILGVTIISDIDATNKIKLQRQ